MRSVMNKNLTPELVQNFHRYLSKAFGFSIVDKKNAIEMEIIARVLPKITPIDPKIFMTKYSTTLYNQVYLPYEIGQGKKSDLFSQIVTITHEAQHVADFGTNPTDMALYLVLDAQRTRIEVRAMTSKIYLQWWYNGTIPNLTKMVESLYYYGLDASDQNVARKQLKVHASIARRGIVPRNLVVNRAVSWLRKNCK